MPCYKFYYFDIPARGETARMLFKLADQAFEDVRVNRKDWPELKPKAVFNAVPYLEVDGEVIGNSMAINRYLAGQFGLDGDTPMQRAQADMIASYCEEILEKAVPIFREQDFEKRRQLQQELNQILPGKFDNLLRLLEKNNDGNGFFLGDKLLYTDLVFVNLMDSAINLSGEDYWSKYPKFKALRERVLAEPKIAAWVAERPSIM